MPAILDRLNQFVAGLGGSKVFHSLLRGAGSLVAIRVASMGLAFALHLFLARQLGPSEYGHYSYAAAWVAFLQVIAAFGLPDASIRFISAYIAEARWGMLRGFLRHSLVTVVFASGLVTGIFALGVWWSRGELDPSRANALFMAALATPPVAFVAVWATRLRGLKRVAESALPMDIFHPLVFVVFFLVAGNVFASSPTGADAMLAHGVGATAAFLLAIWFFRRALPSQVVSAPPESDDAHWARVSAPLMAMSLLVMTRARSTTLLVGFFKAAEEVGYFASANRVASLTSFGAMAIAVWAAPFISEMHARGDREGLQRLVRLATRVGIALMLPVAAGLFVFGGDVLALFGEEFRAAYSVLMILTIGQLVNALTGPVGFLMTMTGNQNAATGIEVLSAALQVGLVVALLPTWGIEGAALGTAVATVFRNLAMFTVAWRRTGIRSSVL